MTPEEKQRLIAAAYTKHQRMFGSGITERTSLCMARSFLSVAESAGYTQFVIQGGSAFFKYQRGRSSEMFGYSYNEVEALTDIKFDRAPNMHVWVADISEGAEKDIIDLSIGVQPVIAKDHGLEWLPSLRPEEWLWGKPNQHHAIYIPDEFATKLAYIFAVGLTIK